MPWIEITLETTPEQLTADEEAFWSLGALAVTISNQDSDDLWEPDPSQQPLWTDAKLVALFEGTVDVDALLTQGETLFSGRSLQANPLEDRDWSREWMNNYHPLCFGERFWICPSWCEAPSDALPILWFDPGLAFGTGTHPTTALCLETLAQCDSRDAHVLDYGCGSGILGLASLLLGAQDVVAVDHCTDALMATHQNAQRNPGHAKRVQTVLPEAYEPAAFDLVFANILAGPLVSLAPRLMDAVKPNGTLILSGLLLEQKEEVIAAYTETLTLVEERLREDWVCLRFRR